jgi:hypothetical protein
MLSVMVRLFRKSEEKIALQASAREEIKRLRALSKDEMAVILLSALGPEEVEPGHYLRQQQLCEYLLRATPGIGQTLPLQLMAPVRRALERLGEADLAESMALERSPRWRITDAGTKVLAEGTAEQVLAAPS